MKDLFLYEKNEKQHNKLKNNKKNSKKESLFSKIKSVLLISILIVLIMLIILILIYLYFFYTPPFYNVLIGDIGGTNIRLKLLRMTKDIKIEPLTLKSEYKSTFHYESLEIILKEFISQLDSKSKPEYAVLGIPGPVENNQLLTLPNIPHWTLENGDVLGQKLGIKKFIFLNDFVCNGYSIQTDLKENEDYIKLNDVTAKKDGPKLMIGPGTGLGMGFLLKNKKDKYYIIGSSEGGGQDFVGKTEFLMKLKEFIRDEVGLGNVSIGKMCSGRALIPIYKFLHLYGDENHKKFKRDEELGSRIDYFKSYKHVHKVGDLNMEITRKGLNGECELCRQTLLLFTEIFGEIAGDLALFTLPTGGVYLMGGLARILTPLILNNTIFMNHFKNKDRFWFILQKLPIYLVQNQDIGLVGATEAARRILEKID